MAYEEPIRVLRIIARLNVGGPALHVSYLSSELDKIGYQTTLAAGKIGEGEGSMESTALERGIHPVYVPTLQREISPFVDGIAVFQILRLIRELRPDVLHTHTAKAGAVGRVAAMLAGSARPPAVVHTFHGHVLRGYFSPAKAEAFRRLESSLARVSDALVAVSPEVRDDLIGLGVAPPEKVVVIRLGLDLAARTAVAPGAADELRREAGVPADAFLVGWLGRLTEIKRPADLLEAFARVHVPQGAHLLVAGDGPLRADMEALAASLGIGDRVHFVGFRSDVGAVYAACDAVALTSANEGTPVSVIEALAAGRPVVSTDVGGVSDIVREGRSGFLVPAGDVDAISDRLMRLAADPDLRHAFGEAGRSDVVPRYSVPRLVSDVDSLYRRLLDEKLSRAPRPSIVLPRRRRRVSQPLTPALGPRVVTPAARSLRVVLVSQYFPPEVGATQTRIQSFAEHLAARGHDVTVIAEFPNHPHGVIPPDYRGRLFEVDRSNPYRVVRVWVKTSKEKTQMTRLSFYLSYMALATAVSPIAGRADVVVATTPPLFTALAGLAIAKLSGAPLVLDVRDLWPAAATSLKQISPGWETRMGESIERRAYRAAAAVTAVTRPFCEHVDRIRGVGPPAVLLPNGTLERFFVDADPEARLGIGNDRFLATFAGTLGIAQALPTLIDAAELLEGEADIAFVGDGPMKDSLEETVRSRGISNVHFHPQMPLEEIPPVLASSDALLVPLSAHPTFEQFVPSKLTDFMAAGRPVIVSAAGEAARILTEAGAGIAVPPEDPAALAAAIRELAADPDRANAMGRRGTAYAASRLRSVQAQRLEELLLDLVED
jgi:glycosyltransferase involved in cell wall biosynthesis